MTADRSIRYDFGTCEVDYVTESDFYSNVSVRFRQIDGGDEAQVTLTQDDARDLLRRIAGVFGADPTGLIHAQLNGQQMASRKEHNDRVH